MELAYVIRLPVDPTGPWAVLQREHTRPSRGLWERLRRGREVTVVDTVGVFRLSQRVLDWDHNLNRPDTLDVHLRGRDALSALAEGRNT